jgi:hypothetical protein
MKGPYKDGHGLTSFVTVMFCPACNSNLDDVPTGTPCPQCGGTDRSATAFAEAAGAVVAVGEVSLLLTKGDHRPWQEKWRKVLQRLNALHDAYSTDARTLGNDEIDGRVESFFTECNHLRDWLKRDLRSLRGVTAADLTRHYKHSDVLKTCTAISNTDKHHTSDGGITARIRETSITPAGARVTIEKNWASPHPERIDALDLANACVASWRAFFQAHGISEL